MKSLKSARARTRRKTHLQRNETIPAEFSITERLARLRLIRTPGIGPLRFHRLIETFGNGVEALAALPSMKRGTSAPPPDPSTIDAELARVERLGAQPLFHGEDGYPQHLANLPDAPALLYAMGDPDLMQTPGIAMVGSRTASANGCRFAKAIASDLGAQGHVIISGLARGIDRAAHEGGLSTGTIAVIAGGFDHPYPTENKDMHRQIADHGLLLTEMPPDEKPTARHFPRRNRIVSGLAQAVIVIEAAARSGSLITARQAAEQGRDVMAVPGAPYDPRSAGSNQLIKDGAALVESVDDIIGNLSLFSAPRPLKQSPAPKTDKPIAEAAPTAEPGTNDDLLTLIGVEPTAVDWLIEQTGMAADQVQTRLIDLELSGEIERLPGDKIARISGR